MATKNLAFRPTADVSVEHSLQGANTAWQCLSEVTADDDATYIYQSVSGTSSTSKVTTVNMTGNVGAGSSIEVSTATLYVRAIQTSSGTATASVECSIDGQSTTGSVDVDTTWTTTQINVDPTLFTKTGDYTIPLTITTSGRKAQSKDSSFEIRITQAYLQITYKTYITLNVLQCGTGSISGHTPTGLVETPVTRTIVVDGTTTRFVKAYKDDVDITSQFRDNTEHVDLKDSDITATNRGTATYEWKKDGTLQYTSTTSGNQVRYGISRFTLNLPQEITLNFSVVRPANTSDYVYIGKVDTDFPTNSQPTSTQYAQRWQGNTSTTPVTYSMIIPAGEHYFDMMNYHARSNSTRTATVTFSSPGYDIVKSCKTYDLNSEADTTIKIIFSDYVETWVKDGNTWKKASKVYKKLNGVWVEQTPQTQSIIKPLFDEDFITEKI